MDKKGQVQVTGRGGCNWDKKRSNPNCESTMGLQLGKKVEPQLRVDGGLASGTKKCEVPVASQERTCNWDKRWSDPSCESRVDLQLGQNDQVPVASRGWACNLDKKWSSANCESRGQKRRLTCLGQQQDTQKTNSDNHDRR